MSRSGRKPLTYRGRPFDLTVKNVCAECNNGWMSEIENSTKDILVPMIDGQSMSLDLDAQRKLASWTCKTAMVMEHTLGDAGMIYWRQDERAAISKSPHEPPSDATVRIAASDGQVLSFFTGGVRQMVGVVSKTSRGPGTCATMVMGALVLQIDSSRWKGLPGETVIVWAHPHANRSVEVWPKPKNEVNWPSAKPLDPTRLRAFAHGWSAVPEGYAPD